MEIVVSQNTAVAKKVIDVQSDKDARTRTYAAYTIRRKDGMKVKVPRSVSSLPCVILMRTRADMASIRGTRLIVTVRNQDDWSSVHNEVMSIIDAAA